MSLGLHMYIATENGQSLLILALGLPVVFVNLSCLPIRHA